MGIIYVLRMASDFTSSQSIACDIDLPCRVVISLNASCIASVIHMTLGFISNSFILYTVPTDRHGPTRCTLQILQHVWLAGRHKASRTPVAESGWRAIRCSAPYVSLVRYIRVQRDVSLGKHSTTNTPLGHCILACVLVSDKLVKWQNFNQNTNRKYYTCFSHWLRF